MDITKFIEKFNRIDGNIYTIEEVVTPVDGVYEAPLIHDNVELKTINIYTGSKLTGNKITTYSTSTPSLTPWKTVIKIFSAISPLYITYETTGDQVEAEDINNLQDAINLTQEELNKDTNRAISRENNIEKNLNSEIERAKASEKNISDNLGNEITRSKNKENELLKAIENEVKRASDTENKINTDLNTEINRAKNAESTETTRATNRENVIENNLTAEIKRSTDCENNITKNLEAESNRAKKREEELNSNINTTNNNLANEINRSTQAEKVLTDNLNTEINRAKSVESDITSKLNEEVNRAKTKENSIESNFNNYKTSNDSEIQSLKEKDTDLQNKKSDKTYVDTELNKRYTKEQTFTKEEVLQKIKDVIGTAPEALDTLKEIADSLNNDANFAGTMTKQLAIKVDKVQGKQLSDENYTSNEKNKLAKVEDEANKYIHPTNHSTDMIIENSNKRFVSDTEKAKWNTVSDKANKTDIPSKLSQLTNDKKFITQSDIDTSQNHIHANKPILDKINQEILDDINLSADKVLKNKLTPIKTDSTLTKLSDCAGGYVRNMQIRGKTLQNLVSKTVNTVTQYTNFCFSDLLKPNTKYTVVVYNDSDTEYKYYFNEDAFVDSLHRDFKKGLNISVNTTKDTISNNIVLKNYTGGNASFTLKDFMLLEGDWTNKEIPSYFEGIKSTGEAEDNKISILTKGKNLLDTNADVKINLNLNGYCSWDGHKLVIDTGDKPAQYMTSYFQVKLYQGVNYKINYKANIISGREMCDIKTLNDKYISKGDAGTIFTVPKTDNYKIIFYSTSNTAILGKLEYTDITLVANNDDASYVEPKTDKTEILLPSPHCGLPSGISDVIDYEENERIKNIGKALFVGSDSENWSMRTDTNANKDSIMFINPLNVNSGDSVMCNRFVNNNNLWNEETEGIQSTITQRDIRIRISKSKLETQDVAGFKKWLQANPTTVYYQLANPITEKLNIKDTLQTFTDGYIQLNNAITPTTQLEYSTNLPSVLSGVVEIQDKLIDRVNILEKKKSITWDELEGV